MSSLTKEKSIKPIIDKQQMMWLLLIIWLHVSLLDLFYINDQGAVFLWQENSQLVTLAIHASIALVTVGFCFIVTKIICQRVNN